MSDMDRTVPWPRHIVLLPDVVAGGEHAASRRDAVTILPAGQHRREGGGST
jgi:hypothetical protein